MSRLTGLRTPFAAVALVAVLVSLAGCSSSNKNAIYDHENFDESGTFSRTYPITDVASCEAARRALLSQGYIITSSDPKLVSGHKSFQQTGDTHMEISFNVVCATDAGHGATVFANALQDRYALKKTNNSASLGVGVLGSLSMPIGSTDDSMVKVASETVTSDQFYDRYFALVENFLPKGIKSQNKTDEKPKAELGTPEPATAPAQKEQKPGAQAAPVAPAVVAPAALTPAVPAQPAVPAASASPAASVVAAPTAGDTVAATPTPTDVAASPSSQPAAPLVTPAPEAPAVPAPLQAVDETVQSQTVVPPAEIDAPISARQASTP